MSLKNQKRIASQLMKCSPHRIHFDPERHADIKEAITKIDMRGLIKEGVVTARPEQGISRGRMRMMRRKKKRGQGKGHGSRKGARTAREGKKIKWVRAIRGQRTFIGTLREQGKVDAKTFRQLYRKAKGGFFRNIRHITLYIEENKLMLK